MEAGRRQGGGLLPSGCKWAVNAPFIDGDFPLTREYDRFYDDNITRLRREHESFCRTSCGEPDPYMCPGGFPPKELERSLHCDAYRIDANVISVGCIEVKPSGMMAVLTYHGLNIRARGDTVEHFELESFFAPGTNWTDAIGKSLTAHDKHHRDFVRLLNESSPPWKSPILSHMNVNKTGFVFTLMRGVNVPAEVGQSIEVPFSELNGALR